MLWTLQWYIFREMGKVFLLTAIGLTALLGLGGGVLNMIELEQATALDLFRIMSLVLPVAAAMALPVAALFSATATYGRLSADNELVACRASGINIHYLMASALAISIVSAAIGFACVNYILPGVIQNLNRLVRTNMDQIVQHALTSPQRLPLMGDRYRFYADKAEVLHDVSSNGKTAEDRVVLTGVAFVEMGKGKWLRYGTARAVDLRFDMGPSTPTAEADLYGVSYYDRSRKQFIDAEQWGTLPHPLRQKVPMKLKWMNLNRLLWYRNQPEKLPNIQEGLGTLRAGIALALYYDFIVQAWRDAAGEPIKLGDSRVSLGLTAGKLRIDKKDGRPFLFDGVTVSERVAGRERIAEGAQAAIDVDRSSDFPMGRVTVTVTGGVRISDPAAPGSVIEKPRERLEAFPLPREHRDRATSYSDRWLLTEDAELKLGTRVQEQQAELTEELAKSRRKIAKEIHSRLAFSVSTLVLVILGAALGIAFRGSHALTAFGISAVPTVLVIAVIIAGRQLAEKPGTTIIGLLVMWGGIGAVALLDVWAMRKLVKR